MRRGFSPGASPSLRRLGLVGAVSFSDPMLRETADGRTIFKGHVGTIYQAHNAVYLGRARADGLRLLPDGSVLHNRSIAKVRKMDRGWRYVVAELEAKGAPVFRPEDERDPRDWLAWTEWLLVRRVQHPGNHKYAWVFDKRDRKHLPESKPYPKFHRQPEEIAA